MMLCNLRNLQCGSTKHFPPFVAHFISTFFEKNQLCQKCQGILAWQQKLKTNHVKIHRLRLRCSRGSVLAFGIQVRGFASGRSLRIFRAKKILSTPSFGGEAKPSVPCRSFTACKRSLNVTWKSPFWQKSRTFLAHISTFRRWVLSSGDTRGDAWWRKLERLTQIAQ